MEPPKRSIEKSVIIHRDENGFGFRVTGQNPVFVDCVHENGAAWKAGVRKNDCIIKVNGTLVSSCDHQAVVQMIQSSTPFVNLTLHSNEIINDSNPIIVAGSQSSEPNNTSLHLSNSCSNLNNINVSNTTKVHSLQQRVHHPHSVPTNVNWLLDIGDDLFLDSQQKTQQLIDRDNMSLNSSTQPVGVSKLIVSGPSPITTSHAKTRNKNQSSTRDTNPYYYYKTVPENGPEGNPCNSSTSALLNQDQSSSKPSALSIARSVSSSKMSTRSVNAKYKPRNLRSRIVEDFKALAINNSQTTPSSLSTSPSSSDLSDCDDQDSIRLDCLSLNTSNSSAGGDNQTHPGSSNIPGTMSSNQGANLKPKHTTRRLEIIRELIDTEKTHTEKLKHLNDLLYKPIKAENLVPVDQLKMIFSCHKTLFKIHRQIYKLLSAAQMSTSECHQEPLIGKALVEIFEGELGRRLEKAASTFCACQSTNTELLNRFTRKDTKSGEYLAQVANQQMFGRLGIKDLLASCFQRLTKYPLLLENLLKATPSGTGGMHSKSLSEGFISASIVTSMVNSAPTPGIDTNNFGHNELETNEKKTSASPNNATNNNNDELANTLEDIYSFERLCISRALNQSRQIVNHVNEAVKRAISHSKFRDIWKKADRNSLPEINLETEQVLHDGPLTLRLAHRSFDVYVLLLTHYLVILTHEGQEKYKVKYFTVEGSKEQCSPVFTICRELVTRDSATDENGFFLVCWSQKKGESRMYEFATQSPAEKAKWKEKIHMALTYNYAVVPDDDNTLTRYTELITLDTSSNTPDNIEH